MRCSIVVPALALAFTTPAFSQQTPVVDQQLRSKAETIVMQYVDAVNKGDGRALAALFAPDATNITPYGKRRMTGAMTEAEGQEAVDLPHRLGLSLSAKPDDFESLFGGQALLVTAPYTATFTNNPATPQVRGNVMFLLERMGDNWKIRVHTASRLAPNAPSP